MTRVVNLYKEKYDVYIGRSGKGQDGYFGNPYSKHDTIPCELCNEIHSKSGDTIKCFEIYFLERIKMDETFKNRVLSLQGKTLGCFCKPKNPCHGDIIVKWLDEQN